MTETELTILGRTVRGDIEAPVADHLHIRWVDALATAALPADPVVVELCTRPELRPPDGPTVPGLNELGYRPVGPDRFWVIERDPAAGAVLVDLTTATAVLHLTGSPFAAFIALDAALSEALAATGMVGLHAAVVTRDGATLALLGPSGRGKSTTALRAALAGWRIVTEDGCFVDAASLTVYGLGDVVRLRPDAPDRLGTALAGVRVGPELEGRRPVPFTAVGGRADAAALTHLVHLSAHRGPEPAWVPMSRAEGVMALHESCGIPLAERVARLHSGWFPEVVARTRRLRLDPGPATSPFPDLPRRG